MSDSRLIGRAERADAALAQTLASAFHNDPAFSWIIPDPAKRARILPRFFQVCEAQSLRSGLILASHGREAASLWFPPGRVRENPISTLADNLRYAAIFGRDLPRGLAIAEAIHLHHPDPQPYWYLRYIGVDPAKQGKGWGGSALRAGIERAAQAGCGVLLETATPGNVAIYARHGFEIRKEWQPPKGGPTFWTMVREIG